MQQEVRADRLHGRPRAKGRRRNLSRMVLLSMALFLTVSAAFSFPTLANGFADSWFGYVTIAQRPQLVAVLQTAQADGVVMTNDGWRHENYSLVTPSQAIILVDQSIQVFRQSNLNLRAFCSPYDIVLSPTVASAIESQGLPIALPNTKPYEFLNASYEYIYTWGWRNMTSFNDPRYVGAEAMIIQQQPRYVVLHIQDWNNYSQRLMQTYLSTTPRTDVVIRMDDINPNTSPSLVTSALALLHYQSLEELAYAIIPSAPLSDNPSFVGIGSNIVLGGYWVFYVATAFFPACFLFMWRYTTDEDTDVDGSSSEAGEQPSPRVSIVVPAYNEEEGIKDCIDAILAQDYAGDKEVIVVDDGSTDGTAAVVSRYPVRLIRQEVNMGKAHALNAGVEAATGEIIVFSDSDSKMEKDSVRLLVGYLLRNRDVGAVAGCLQVKTSRPNLLTAFQELEYRIGQEVDKFLQGKSGNVLVCPGPLFAARREVVKQFPFNENSVIEDADFTTRLLKAGLLVGLERRAVVYTDVPRTIRAWSRQRSRWWAGFLELWKTHKPWSRRNTWMLHNYILGYVVSIISVALLILIPLLASTYSIPSIELERGLLFALFPIGFFMVLYAPFLSKRKRLILLLPLYSTVYFLVKSVLLASLYLRYLLRLKFFVRFGSRKILVRW